MPNEVKPSPYRFYLVMDGSSYELKPKDGDKFTTVDEATEILNVLVKAIRIVVELTDGTILAVPNEKMKSVYFLAQR